MPTNTPNLNLEKPLGNEKYDVNKINANFDKIDSNALNKLTYKGEVALLADLPSTNQKIGDYYIVIEKGVPYLWNGTEFKAQISDLSLGKIISNTDTKVTPDVDDVFGYSDSEDVVNPNILKKLTWGNIRGSLATFFEGIFALVLHGHAIGDVTGLQTSLDSKATYTSLRPKNWIINGMFDVWQRATSQTDSGYASDDRWNNEKATSTRTHSRQAFAIGQTDVPNNPSYFSRSVVTTGGTVSERTKKTQRIEDVTKLAGKTITVSFWAKADSNKNIAIELRQYFGVGGSAEVVGIGVQKFALTNLWQRFTKTVTIPSVSGKTINANNFLELSFWFDAGSDFNARTDSLGNQSGTFDIANVSLVEGSVAIECQNQPYADVLRDCQRYYLRYQDSSDNIVQGFGIGEHTTRTKYFYQFTVPMRKKPTVTYSDISVWNVSVGTYPVTAISMEKADESVCIVNLDTASGGVNGRPMFILANNTNAHIAFDAEL